MNQVPRFEVRDLGRADYAATLALQRRLVEARRVDAVGDVLLLVEHPPTITLGRRKGALEHVITSDRETPIIAVERGGDVTWHGPGQLVGYPIFALRPAERDVHAVLRRLEDALIAVLAACALEGERRPGFTGVWCRDRKLASLGVAVQHWVTFHGFALNVDPDLSAFAQIQPCGLDPAVMGSIASVGGIVPARAALLDLVVDAVASAFQRAPAGDRSEHRGPLG